ncbi:hypothetical protein BOTBODRAFT_52624 [Botryobasidium botryosum FD-172 SS1]|uniref:Pyridoxamine kinase/Phosphomethylpyrimidine kinase domain-containing protein n=1 Tax=Botryobasidium botryosum (strain FD-172 SS1) TaxID=930990 RepID=A0A067N3G0_BOTB1|nr:hypothetical protein BOTBODRAFT_52624 [Botryobasidium botryosum FD-172 SS1]
MEFTGVRPKGVPPAILTIAGTDPSGGAGIQADLKTFTALECYGTSVVTALVAQNTLGVQDIFPCPPEFMKRQLLSVLEDIPVQAIKTGMMFDSHTIRAVVDTLRSFYTSGLPPLVVDPVAMSTSGHTLLEADAISHLKSDLLPMATLITPNIPEAELLLSHDAAESTKIASIQDMKSAAERLSSGYKIPAVLVKGGHLSLTVSDVCREAENGTRVEWAYGCGPDYPEVLRATSEYNSSSEQPPIRGDAVVVVDVLHQDGNESGSQSTLFVSPRIDTTSTHGTGCTLSAALASYLGAGLSVLEATRLATIYTHAGISAAFPIGQGHGPLNHLHTILPRAVPRPTPSLPFPFITALIESSRATWTSYVRHEFVRKLGNATLPRDNFVHFIKQDYHYLKHYARAHGQLALKSSDFESISAAATIALSIAGEKSIHESFCAEWSISAAELQSTPESPAATAYALYILDEGVRGDELSLLVALAACLLGYGEVGLWLKTEAAREGSDVFLEGNPYIKWIETYGGERYQRACREGIAALEKRVEATPLTVPRFRELAKIWERCTKLETGFWDMAMTLS